MMGKNDKGGPIMESIDLKAAQEAIADLIKTDAEREEVMKLLGAEDLDLEKSKEGILALITDEDIRTTVSQVLDSVEIEKSDEVTEPEVPTLDALKETIKAFNDEDRQSLVDFMASLIGADTGAGDADTEKAIEDETPPDAEVPTEPEQPEKTEEALVLESLAGSVKALYSQVKELAEKDPNEALAGLKVIEEQLGKLVEAYPYPDPENENEKSGGPECETDEEEKTATSENSDAKTAEELRRIADRMDGIQKSLKETTQKVRDEQVVEIGEKVTTLEEQIGKLTQVIQEEVPIRKAIVKSEQKPGESTPKTPAEKLIASDEYKNAPPAEKLRMLGMTATGEEAAQSEG
jgi:hypothetical protein